MMMKLHENYFCITGLLWGEAAVADDFILLSMRVNKNLHP